VVADIASIEFGPGHRALTISAGIAEVPRHALKLNELIECADRALYRAKATGRDQFCVATSGASSLDPAEGGAAERHRLHVQNTVQATRIFTPTPSRSTQPRSPRRWGWALGGWRWYGGRESFTTSGRSACPTRSCGRGVPSASRR
jgi:hypothetical protein